MIYLYAQGPKEEFDETFFVNENKILINESNAQSVLEFSYNNVFSTQTDYIKLSYNKTVAPLVRRAVDGESTMLIVGGPQSLNWSEYLLSQNIVQGIISQTAGHMLHSVNEGDNKIGAVTFSWYKIECGSPEQLTDVLKTASTSGAGATPAAIICGV